MEIKKPAINFTLCFKDGGQGEYTDKLKHILEKYGFNWNEACHFFHNEQVNIQQVKNKLFSLCEALRGL